MITLLVIAASSLWGMYLAYKLGRWHGEQVTMSAIRQACVKLKGGKRGESHNNNNR